MNLKPIIGHGVNPRTNAVEEDADEAVSRFARAQGGWALHSGMTRAERVAAGHGGTADRVAVEAANAAHTAWLMSEAGKNWLAVQRW